MESPAFIAFAIAACTVITGLITALATLIRSYKSLKQDLRKERIIIGFSRQVPDVLGHLPVVKSWRSAIVSPRPVVLYQFRQLSWGLRHCDFVVAEMGDDFKIHSPDDEFWGRFLQDA